MNTAVALKEEFNVNDFVAEIIQLTDHERIFEALDDDFVAKFKASNTLFSCAREFVYALDHLDEMTKLEGFTLGQVVMSPDIEPLKLEAFFMFNEFATLSGNKMWKMAMPTPAARASIVEFFDYNYLSVIQTIMLRLEVEKICVMLDGNPYTIEIDKITPYFRTSVLHYRDINRRMSIHIPFNKKRTDHSIGMAD